MSLKSGFVYNIPSHNKLYPCILKLLFNNFLDNFTIDMNGKVAFKKKKKQKKKQF